MEKTLLHPSIHKLSKHAVSMNHVGFHLCRESFETLKATSVDHHAQHSTSDRKLIFSPFLPVSYHIFFIDSIHVTFEWETAIYLSVVSFLKDGERIKVFFVALERERERKRDKKKKEEREKAHSGTVRFSKHSIQVRWEHEGILSDIQAGHTRSHLATITLKNLIKKTPLLPAGHRKKNAIQ